MSWSESTVRANLWRFRGYVFFQSLDFTRGIFVLFLLAQGLTNTQIGVLQSILFWTIFATEIPTGIFADHSRRKTSVGIGLACLCATFALFPFASGFWSYVPIFMLWGLASAFGSGASSALLYDGLKSAGPKWLATHLPELGRLKALSVACVAGSMGVAGIIYTSHPSWAFMLTSIFMIAALLMLACVGEASRADVENGRGWKDVASSLLMFSRTRQGRNMTILMVGLSLLEACHTPLFVLSQSLLKEIGTPPQEIAELMAANFLVSALGMYFAPKLKWTTLRLPVLLAVALMACMVLTISRGHEFLVAIALVVGNLVPNALFVFTDHYIQENADSAIRASWGSVQSFVNSLTIGLSFVVVGWFGDAFGMRMAFLLFLVPLGLCAVCVLWHSWRPIERAAFEAA